jgi:hypothetical protein
MWRFRKFKPLVDRYLVISVVKNREIIIIRSSSECFFLFLKSQYFRDTQVRANGMYVMAGGFPCSAARA